MNPMFLCHWIHLRSKSHNIFRLLFPCFSLPAHNHVISSGWSYSCCFQGTQNSKQEMKSLLDVHCLFQYSLSRDLELTKNAGNNTFIIQPCSALSSKANRIVNYFARCFIPYGLSKWLSALFKPLVPGGSFYCHFNPLPVPRKINKWLQKKNKKPDRHSPQTKTLVTYNN